MRISRLQKKTGLLLILLVYLALAVANSVVVPIGRGADEWAHYWYAQFIAQHQRLPASPAEREAAGYKADWPPLYHALAAAVTGWINTDGPPTFKYRRDSIRRQLVPATGPEAILHTEDEQFPWQQEILVWHLGRFLSIAFSTGTLLVTYFIALEVFQGRRDAGSQSRRVAESQGSRDTRVQVSDLPPAIRNPQFLALAVTAVLAFNPRFLFTGMLFNYDSLTLLLSALFLWLALRVAKGQHARWGFWGLGALAGLALVTKYLALPLPLVIVLVAWLRVAGSQGRRDTGAQSRKVAESQGVAHYVLRSRTFWKFIAQSAIAYLLVSGWWFIYLIITFNQIDQYGPLLGTLAPLIRGDGSDRTVETIFAWLSGGQAPPPAYIQQQSYSAWQIIASFFTTFWGNPVARPYPLTWFIVAMTLVMGLAFIGLILQLRLMQLRIMNTCACAQCRCYELRISGSQFTILLLTCLLPVPFMIVRLFGARDALEAVQGRHILFLAGPAVAVLLVWGVAVVSSQFLVFSSKLRASVTFYVLRFTFYVLLALLLTGSLSQLIFMAHAYPPPAPVKTTALPPSTIRRPPAPVILPGGAQLVSFAFRSLPDALRVDLFWQGGADFAPEDYRTELELVGDGDPVAGWAAYQTQARYPTRAWEPGDVVRDSGWLPLAGVPAGDYQIRWRLVGRDGPLFGWQPLGQWSSDSGHSSPDAPVAVWRDGQPASQPLLTERETAQITNYQLPITNYQLIGPDGAAYPPASAGPGWVNFIIEPNWPPGDYRLVGADTVALRVAPSRRNFQIPAEIKTPLEVSFAGKIKLLGYTLSSRRVQPGDGLPITLYWQAQEWLAEDFVIFTRLLDNQQVAHGGYDRRAQENTSTLLWAPGEIIVDGFAVPVDADAPHGVYRLSVGWYRRVGSQAESLPLVNPDTGQPTGATSVMIGPLKVGGPPPGATVAAAAPQHPVNVSLGDQIELLGFDERMSESATLRIDESGNQLDNSPNSTDSTNSPNSLNLTFYWQALRQPEADYTVFVHLQNEAGEIVAQKDQPLSGGVYPSNLWDTGEIIKDELSVPLAGVAPGRYQVVAGLYNLGTGQRLPVAGAGDEVILLQSVEIPAE